MGALASTIITLLTQILPIVGGDLAPVSSVIGVLTQLLPTAIQEGANLVTPIKNIISALSSNAVVTPAELSQLQALDAQFDAAFEQAAVTAGFKPDTGA